MKTPMQQLREMQSGMEEALRMKELEGEEAEAFRDGWMLAHNRLKRNAQRRHKQYMDKLYKVKELCTRHDWRNDDEQNEAVILIYQVIKHYENL